MNERIDKETFDHLVDLAAIALTENEAQYLRRELNKQINIIQEMAAVAVDDEILLTTHGIQYTPMLSPEIRKDIRQPSDKASAIMSQVPESQDGYILVPQTPHTDLE